MSNNDRDDRVAYEILRSIRKILRKTAEHSRQISRESGLSVAQLLCLRAIADADEATVAMVSQSVQLSPPTVSRILDRLFHSGLIERQRPSADRRKLCHFLTEKGRRQLAKLPTPLHDKFLQRLKTLDDGHQDQLLQSLNQLVEMLEASDVDASPMLTTETDAKAPPLNED